MKTIADIVQSVRRGLAMLTFKSSEKYWIERYQKGGNSGFGSYGELAQYKAEVLNRFVADNGVRTVIEFGCGDGNQLKLAQYSGYVGYDISPEAVAQCRALFADDKTKRFDLVSAYSGETADLALSLDVIYHLVEDSVFAPYMQTLFRASHRYVIIYSTNADQRFLNAPHVRHRCFTEWVQAHVPGWKLAQHIPGYTGAGKQMASTVDFYVYERLAVPQ